MKPKYLFLLLVVISFAQSSCKKSESPKTNTDYLTQKPWVLVGKQTRIETPSGPLDWFDTFKDEQPCVVDDIHTYTAAGRYTKDEGATKCSATYPQRVTDNWTWESTTNGAVFIRLASGGSTNLRRLDDNTLVVEFVFLASGSIPTTNRLTFAHP
jgi:hypothetical protein